MDVSQRICRVVSSEDEAKIFINFYKMRLKKEYTLFPVYSDDLNQNWLVVSGQSKQNSSFAAVYLKNCSNSKSNSGWINFGLGFKKNETNSKLFYIDEIVEIKSKKHFYPSVVNTGGLLRSSISTVSQYQSNSSYFQDLDSYYFYKTVSKFVNQELLAVIKIAANFKELKNKILKQNIIRDNFKKILKIEKSLIIFSKLETTYLTKPLKYEEFLKKYHFSVSQQKELITLLKKWNNINSTNLKKNFKNGTYVLEFLRKEINKVK